MQYDIALKLTQSYASPATGGRHVLCLSPADLPNVQRTITSLVEIFPRPDERVVRTDFFGNSITEIAFRGQHADIQIRVRARVDRRTPPIGLDISPPLSRIAQDIAAIRSLDYNSPHHFLGASTRVTPEPVTRAYARDAIANAGTTLQAVWAIGLALNRDMSFDADATTVDTPFQDAFAQRHGVCQDFTHIMIACLRGVGIPAGYVSGFLRTRPPPGQKRLAGADSMHAWVRAWCGADMGWIEFDPTNAVIAADDHIVIGYGRDYSDVAPVRGVLRTAGAQSSDHTVDVIALDTVA
jgi:transglutaminase-like putative cysteine protease